jgi:nucleotide-binding universal stress UspA family protein
MKVERILVPLDFSDHSERALTSAIEFAKKFSAAIDLLHSYRISYSGILPFGDVFPAALYADVRKHAAEELSKAHQSVQDAGVACATHLSEDEPSHAIVAAAEELSSDLIVMGTHGRTGLEHIALGSVAERTVRAAPCPVLTINQSREES